MNSIYPGVPPVSAPAGRLSRSAGVQREFPYFVLDWDYGTFSLLDNGDVMLYDIEDFDNPPPTVFIEGWLDPVTTVEEPTKYELIARHPVPTYRRQMCAV